MRLLIFGPGYTASRVAAALPDCEAVLVGRAQIDDRLRVNRLIATSSHILSSIPPAEADDPVLQRYGAALAEAPAWIGYLSSTGVYGDVAGAWVDESAPTGGGRRSARSAADRAWLALGARVFRLPGIYGPGRSPLDRLRQPGAYLVDRPGQVFSRIHVDDIVAAVTASFEGPKGAYNIADDLPAPQAEVMRYAARLLGAPPPGTVALDSLAPAARAFYEENRRVANGKAKRLLGWEPRYPTYREGLRALSAMTRPITASAAPHPASSDQR